MTYEEWQLKNDEPHSPKEVWQSAYAAGRDSMKAECVKAVEDQEDMTPLETIANQIKELV